MRCDDFTLGRPVLVGSSNPHSTDPLDALAVDPPRGSGARLWRLSGLTLRDYCDGFAKLNADDEATLRAFRLSLTPASRTVVFGLATAKMMGLVGLIGRPWFSAHRPEREGEFYLAPHPSGINRMYNNQNRVSELRVLMKRLLWEGRSRNDY